MKYLPLLFCLIPMLGSAGDRLVLCGWDEVFMLDAAKPQAGKTWSWRAKDHPELPPALIDAFGTTDDCKPVEAGKRLLISSSSGGCALLELPSGKPLWWARVPNAHTIEALPGGRIAVAASVGAAGNKLVIFDSTQSDRPLAETPLPSAHGLVWDEKRQRLWALGGEELRAYSLRDWDTPTPSLSLEMSHPLPDPDGHDLRPVPGSGDLVLTTGTRVWLFDRDAPSFRAHPDLGLRPRVKCIDIHPASGGFVTLQATEEHWWNDTFEQFQPKATLRLEKERLYKIRWLPEPVGGF